MKAEPKLSREYLTQFVPAEVWLAAQYAYYGGWFEITCHGHIPGETYEYDINSAYPFAISRLPCLEHGSWKHSVVAGRYQNAGTSRMRLLHCSLLGRSRYLGSGLHRSANGNISRPHRTSGWYWEAEIQAAYQAGLIDQCDISESWEYDGKCGHRPLSQLANLYTYRLSVGKNSPQGKAAKLVYNSVYGKFAQSVGSPMFGNSIYASLITSMCRTQILIAIASHTGNGMQPGNRGQANAVVMVATDAVYFTSPHGSLPISDSLGHWDSKVKYNLTLFKPGVYWDDETREAIRSGNDPVFKSRGISAAAFGRRIRQVDEMFDQWNCDAGPDHGRNAKKWPTVSFPAGFAMVSARQANARGKWETAGAVSQDVPVTQNSDPVTKRRGLYRDGKLWRSSPWPDHAYGSGNYESTPYDRRFGQDKEEYGITDDGPVIDLISAAVIG